MTHTRVFALLIFGALILTLGACGKKGPPFLPMRITPPKVENLNAEWIDGTVILKGEVFTSQGQNRGTSHITGARVYHAWYAAENPPCEGCPIQYRLFKEVRGDMSQGDRFSCKIKEIEKKGIHFFKVSLCDTQGRAGPLSDGAKLLLK